MSISSILNIAKNAMFANQTSLQVTSNNIANVNTEGYAKQEAVFEEGVPVSTIAGLLGSGVKISEIVAYYDKYIEKMITDKNTTLEQQKTAEQYFTRIESIVNEDNSNLTQDIVDFFNSWQELSADSANTSNRLAVVVNGQQLSSKIRFMYSQLKSLQTDANNNIKQEVDRINRITSSIAELNQKIFESSSGGEGVNKYINERTNLLKELSAKMDIISFEDSEGRLTIMTSGGKPLVDSSLSWDLEAHVGDDGMYSIRWLGGSGTSYDITNEIKGGSISALVSTRDTYIPEFISDLDGLAQGIIEEVNDLHASAYNLYGQTGVNFFNDITKYYAKDIDLTDDIKGDIKMVATSSSSTNLYDNDIALGIAALGDSTIFDGGQSSAVTYITTMISKAGEYTRQAEDLASFNEDTMTILKQERESVSGVSLDEEMANLIKYQYAFQASARLFNVADTLFQSLLDIQ